MHSIGMNFEVSFASFLHKGPLSRCSTQTPCLLSLAVGGKGGSKEYTRLQKQGLKVLEENNLLKYKVELLLDMLAASNADCIVMQKELEALKKQQR